MEIYILRHGIAEDGKPGQADSGRRLTPEGKEKLAKILACARKAGVQPDVMLSSPYKRAMETAELARQHLKLDKPIIETEVLTPMERAEKVWDEIRIHKDARQVMVVGHEPQLSSVVCYLIGTSSGHVELKKGAIARVDVESIGIRPQGILVWLLTAKLAAA